MAHFLRPLSRLPLALALACGGPADGPADDKDGAPDTSGDGDALEFRGFTPRNVVIVNVDTLRADTLPRWGSEHDTMPMLAARPGWVSVERAVGNASWTGPATASLLTGTDQPAHGIRYPDTTATNASPSFIAHLAAQGVATGMFTGSYVVTTPAFGLIAGFDVVHRLFDDPANTAVLTEPALAWVDTLGPEQPFLMFIQPMDLHAPYRPEDQDVGTWSVADEVPFTLDAPTEAQQAQIEGAYEGATSDEERGRVRDAVRAVYDEQMLGVDRALATLMDGLEERGRLADTMVVLTSDHGESFYDGPPSHFGHGRVLRHELVNVPLMFWGEGLADAHVPCLASNLDVLPTVVDVMGLDPLASAEGASLRDGCRTHAFSSTFEYEPDGERLYHLSAESLDAQLVYNCRSPEILGFDLVADPRARQPLPPEALPGGAALQEALEAYTTEVLTALPTFTCASAGL